MTIETEESSSASNRTKSVVIKDIKMPFWSMVIFIFKWTLASIPAMFIVGTVGAIIWSVLAALFMGGSGPWI